MVFLHDFWQHLIPDTYCTKLLQLNTFQMLIESTCTLLLVKGANYLILVHVAGVTSLIFSAWGCDKSISLYFFRLLGYILHTTLKCLCDNLFGESINFIKQNTKNPFDTIKDVGLEINAQEYLPCCVVWSEWEIICVITGFFHELSHPNHHASNLQHLL